MTYVKQGSSTNLFATFQNIAGVETASSTTPKITVIHVNDSGDTVTDVNAQDMTLVSGSTGQYYYTWTLSSSAYIGSYQVTYSGTIDSKSVSAAETITVLSQSYDPNTGDDDATTLKYSTSLSLNKFMQMDKGIPNRDSSGDPTLENIGTGDGSETIFYFDNGFIIRDSETLYYGATEATATESLVYNTDYTIDWDLGKITLTTSGVTKLSTYVMYASYSYNKFDIKDTLIYQTLVRAEAEVDSRTNSAFYDSTDATPSFEISNDEIHDGRGVDDKVYYADKYPINSKTTTVNGAISADDTIITVVSTNGFPSSGYIAIETNKITYTGKTATTFTGCTNVTAHDDATIVTPFVIEVATDGEGNMPTFVVQEYKSDFDIDFNSGAIRLNNDAYFSSSVDNFMPPQGIWNRVRLSYQYGYDEISGDIVRLTNMIAARELYSGQILNALSRNTDGFSSDGITDIKDQIERLINKYRCILVSDTKG